ncbi:hypothetical protein FSP39_004286 [Pinctada imbricata]|uniref:ZP domain-containing protein n=1 Tax=Pinctada imbricata TaxID=66713 RepID=A0AA88XK74_PINIB|nr:hypothetical protein FSP39_004286 [Pinctada imbricata]
MMPYIDIFLLGLAIGLCCFSGKREGALTSEHEIHLRGSVKGEKEGAGRGWEEGRRGREGKGEKEGEGGGEGERGYSHASACNIVDPFSTDVISAYYATEIKGRGCTSNATNAKSQEVHAINLLNVGPVFRNDVAEVNLFIKSRKGDVLWKPVIFILNSQQPVRWRIRTAIFSPENKKHIFVVPRFSMVKLVKKKRRRQIRKVDAIPSDSQELINWIDQKYGTVTSFTEVKRGNRMNLLVGVEKDAPVECELQDNPSELNAVAKYEQPQFLSGCDTNQAKNPISRLAYIIELDRAHIQPNANMDVEVELDIRSTSKKSAETNFILVLKSPKDVTWKVKTCKLKGYIDVVATGFVDMKEIRMDTVGVRTEDITVSQNALIKWVSDFIGDVGMYAHVGLANKIKLVLPDNGPSSDKSQGGRKEEAVSRINPFLNPARTKSLIKTALHASCSPDGSLVVALRKSLIKKYFGLHRNQISLLHRTCQATENKTDLYIPFDSQSCGTGTKKLPQKVVYANSLVIHPSPLDSDLAEEGSADSELGGQDEEMLDGSGSGSPTPPIMYIDDEDYKATGNIVVEFECEAQITADVTTVRTMRNPNKTYVQPDSDIEFQMDLYRSKFFLDPNYQFPMSVAADGKVYVKVSIHADTSLDVVVQDCWLMPSVDHLDKKDAILLIKNGCREHSSVQWESRHAVLQGLTQTKKFSFQAIGSFPFSFLRCQLTVCRKWENQKYAHAPECQTQEEFCTAGTYPFKRRVPSQQIVRGPMYATESKSIDRGEQKSQKPVEKDPESSINIRTRAPPDKGHPSGQSSRTSNQTIIVEGLDSGTVVGIAFAAFIIGVLLMAALWCPMKHAVVSRSGVDGSGETTPMSTAPLQINS